MFAQLLRQSAMERERPAVVDRQGVVTWGELVAGVDRFVKDLQPVRRHRVALRMQPTASCIATLAALDQLQCDAFLVDDQIRGEKLHELIHELQLDGYVELVASENSVAPSSLAAVPRGVGTWHQPDDGPAGSVTILTSGTSGKPKAARHTWTSLSRPIRRGATEPPQRWLLSYRPHLYAGLQVLLQCFVHSGTLVIDDSQGDVTRLIRLMVDRRVGYVSATPSYWRRLFLLGDRDHLAQVPLVQITLGGEVVDGAILTLLSRTFPSARIVHIYATTELGRCFSVTDKQPGFPARFLQNVSADGVAMKMDDGELLVRSANRMQAYDAQSAGGVTITDDGWMRTGDLVELRDGRVYFTGRRSDLINVGGNKVAPLTVENTIRAVPGVADVRVYAKSSSIAGQLVACDIVVSPTYPPDVVRRQVVEHCRSHLADHERPRWIAVTDQIRLTPAGKVSRGIDAS